MLKLTRKFPTENFHSELWINTDRVLTIFTVTQIRSDDVQHTFTRIDFGHEDYYDVAESIETIGQLWPRS